jgi:hypothetical protein
MTLDLETRIEDRIYHTPTEGSRFAIHIVDPKLQTTSAW